MWRLLCGPVAKTLRFQRKRSRFNPWSGNYIPHATTKDPAWIFSLVRVVTKTQHLQINKIKINIKYKGYNM